MRAPGAARPAPPPARAGLAATGLLACLLAWLPAVAGPYGYFGDELYYLACSLRLAWGYVDHPPLSVALLALVRRVAGDGLAALRLVPALLAGALAVATGLLARRLGAGPFGQTLAALGVVTAGIPMVIFSFYSMNALDLVAWTGALWLLVEVEEGRAPAPWLAFGAVLGAGLLNKHTIVLLPLALVPAMLLTPARRHLRAPRFWLGLGLAAAILGPNLLWQAAHGWPSLEFYRNADLLKNNPTPPHEVVLQQVLFMNPLALPVWLGGLLFLLGSGRDGRLRHLGLAYLLLLAALALGQKSRPDRLAPMYPLLFAAGGAAADLAVARLRAAWLRPAALAAVAAGGLVLAPAAVPLLAPPVVAAYGARLGLLPQIEAGPGKRAALPQWLSDRLEWEAFVRDVAAVARRLAPEERARAAILAPAYGLAGALELLGRDAGLPPVHSGHNSYHLWGPPPEATATLVVAGHREADVRRFFGDVERAATHRCVWCTPWRDGMPIWIARRPLRPIAELWAAVRHFE